MRKKRRQKPRRDDPAEKAANEPVGFPSPAFHAAIRNIKASGGETSEPVKEDSKCGIWDQKRLDEMLDMKDLFQRLHCLVWKQTPRLDKKISHLRLPSSVDG